MNDEQRMARTLKDFYLDDAAGAHDRDAILRGALDTVHTTRQQRRWRWWPFRRHATPTSTLPNRELQPDPLAATNGNAPTSSGSVPALFGAIRFALAGVIVALFGGFLVFGVLAPQPQDGLPGAVGTPSPSSSPTRSDVDATPISDPPEEDMQLKTAAATLAAAMTFIPAPVSAQEPTFVVEQVEPFVSRIINDGADFDMTRLEPDEVFALEDITAAPNGDIWVVGYRYTAGTGPRGGDGPMAWKLGSPGEYRVPWDFTKLVILDDGTPAVVGRAAARNPAAISVFDGERFVESPGTRRNDEGNSTSWLIEPEDLASLDSGSVDF